MYFCRGPFDNHVSFSVGISRSSAVLAGVCLFLVVAGVGNGCRQAKPARMAASEIHRVTREFAAAASAASPAGTVVKIKQSATDRNSASADEIYVGLKSASRAEEASSEAATIVQALRSVATREQLTQDTPAPGENGLRLLVRHGGEITHRIQIVRRVAVLSRPVGEIPGGGNPGAKLAIILDDLGSDRAAADAIFALAYPLTISVLPGHAHSVEIAEEAHRRGYEVMLHLPMQSVAKEQPEPEELHPGMRAEEVNRLVEKFLQAVPNVVGVNNHQGSQATADGTLMGELMPVLRERHLFYVDSRTTVATVAYDTAQRFAVHAGSRNVPFLDDVAEVAAVARQLELAIRGARVKGQAIAIGHPRPATLQALRAVLPRAEAQGVKLVFASDLVH